MAEAQNLPVPVSNPTGLSPAIVHKLVVKGDLSGLTEPEKVQYITSLCEATGLPVATVPFAFIPTSGGLKCYATRSCTDGLRQLYGVSLETVSRAEMDGGVYAVVVKATMPNGRTLENIGVTSVLNLKGKDKAVAMMVAETKAQRRATLAICGLGFLDESEMDLVKGANGPIGQVELDYLHDLLNTHQITEAQAKTYLGVETLSGISKAQWSEITTRIKVRKSLERGPQ